MTSRSSRILSLTRITPSPRRRERGAEERAKGKERQSEKWTRQREG